MLTAIQGIYRAGKIILTTIPNNVREETPVIVTFLDSNLDLRAYGMDETQAADLRARLTTFAEDWESPEMEIYNNYDIAKAKL